MKVPNYNSMFVILFIYGLEFIQKAYACECGKNESLGGRIVGGITAKPHDFPWMAGIYSSGSFYCGGSLINDRYILTAAHCLKGATIKDTTVVLGQNEVRSKEAKKKRLKIKALITHEKLKVFEIYDLNDIGLILLEKPVKFSDSINPVCLPQKDDQYVSKKAHVSGWGRLEKDGELPKVLMTTQLRVMSLKECQNIPKYGNKVVESMLCAMGSKNDACQGDSGGPLVISNAKGRIEQIGIVSWGIGCATPRVPGFYTRVSFFYDWIKSKTKDATYCKS